MSFRPEVIPFLLAVAVLALLCWGGLRLLRVRPKRAFFSATLLLLIGCGYMLYFFRDPERVAPADPDAIVAGADGVIMSITNVYEPRFLKTETVRVSIFLSLIDVHVNRAPLAGRIKNLRYTPGKRYFTFQEKSSEYNQHNSIHIEGTDTSCLVNQIVGPVARRVVYWLVPDQMVAKGERIGMMKFSSRLDMYFPAGDVEVTAGIGQKVRAGETVVARLKKDVP